MLLNIILSSLLSFAPLSEEAAEDAYIYEDPHRPKVALVLSGGGAKGLVHIGVLQYLKEMGIPVDFVVGTSIGSIVGAMYSLGYEPDEMQRILSSLDWSYYLGDGVERNQMMYQQKINSDSYDLDFPFGTGEITLDRFRGRSRDRSQASSLLKSFMPSGIIEGNNILNLFNDMSIGYTEEMNFADLPIPFACVSTNIVDGTANIHTRGVLPLALRASMSMPGVFNPVYNEKQVLVDGGIRNNFPVDIARQMGADIVIGVNLAIEKESDPEKLRPYLSQMSQLIKIFIGNGLEENSKSCDVLVYPDLKGRGSLDFSQKNMDELVAIGYDEAIKHDGEFRWIHNLLAQYGDTVQTYQAPKAHNLLGKTFCLSQVNFTGIKNEDMDWILSHSGLRLNTPITLDNIKDVVSALYGTRAYSSVIYSLDEDMSGGYAITFRLTPQKPHTLDFSLRFDSHDALQSVMRIGVNEQILHGFQSELVAKLSYNPYISAKASYVSLKFPRVSVSYELGKRDTDLYEDGVLANNFRYISHRLRFYLSDFSRVNFSYKVGTQYDRMSFLRALSSYWETSIDSKMLPIRTLGLFFEGHYDTMDNTYFPMRGIQSELRINQNFWHFRESGADFRPFTVFNASVRKVFNVSDRWAFIPQSYLAVNLDAACKWDRELFPATYGEDMALGHNPVYPQKMGGVFRDYDFYGQIPFVGLYHTASVDDAVVLRLDTRYKVKTGKFATLKCNYARADDFNAFGVAAEYGIETLFGPVSFEVGWNNITNKAGVFISMGRMF